MRSITITATDLVILACLQLLVLGGVAQYLTGLNDDRKNTPTAQQRDAKAHRLCREHEGLDYVYVVLLTQDSEKALCNDKARFRIATGQLINPASMQCRIKGNCVMEQ